MWPPLVGMMVLLASSSAIAAPVLLHLLLPLLSSSATLQVDSGQIVVTLLATQLAPLCLGAGRTPLVTEASQ